MQTHFTPERLADPKLQSLEKILRSCVHCGLCTATCPTYVVGGDERDSPRGRIYLIKDLLESGRTPTAEDVKPIDHCLSCYSCMTTCPSGVDYRRLVDHAREVIETDYRRPWPERALRAVLGFVLPSPSRFRLAVRLANLARPLRPLITRLPRLGRALAAMLDLAPKRLARAEPATKVLAQSEIGAGRRVALWEGCAQSVLAPEINAATARLLGRLGFDVVRLPGAGCCGSLLFHMGREDGARAQMRRAIDAFMREVDAGGLEAILVTASGCGATIKDYGALLADDFVYAKRAARVAALALDPTEFLVGLDFKFSAPRKYAVAYHAACSLQHGQKISEAPKLLLRRAGFEVWTPAESHLCCGSAGVYNILQPEIADALKARKLSHLNRLKPDMIAAGNIGCLTQLKRGAEAPVAHVVELLDWAMGGPRGDPRLQPARSRLRGHGS